MKSNGSAALLLVAFACAATTSGGAVFAEPIVREIPSSTPIEELSQTAVPIDAGGRQRPFERQFAHPSIVRGWQSLAAGRVDEGLRHLQTAVEAEPSLPPEVLLMAYLYLSHHRLEEAKLTLEKAAQLYKDHPEVYHACGQLALAQERNADAWAHFQTALRLEAPAAWPDEQRDAFKIQCLSGLAAVSENRGDWPAAAEIFSRLDVHRPSSAGDYSRWAKALLWSGDESAALEKLVRAHSMDPSLNPPELAIAALHTENGAFESARPWYEAAVQKYPSDGRAYFEHAGALLFAGKGAEAENELDRARQAGAELGGLSVEIALLRGLIARSERKFVEAEEHFGEALRQAPGQPTALYHLPMVLVEQDDRAKRERAMQIALIHAQRRPHSAQAWTTLGYVQFRMGKLQEAEQSLAKAASGPAASAEALYFLARVLIDGGKANAAEPYIESLRTAMSTPQLFLLREEARRWLESVALVIPADEGDSPR